MTTSPGWEDADLSSLIATRLGLTHFQFTAKDGQVLEGADVGEYARTVAELRNDTYLVLGPNLAWEYGERLPYNALHFEGDFGEVVASFRSAYDW